MAITFPVLAFIFILLCLNVRGCGYRQSFLGAAVTYGALLVISTEVLGSFSMITYRSVAVFWGIVASLALSYFFLNRANLKTKQFQVTSPTILACISFVLGTTLLVAIVSPPNNFDSMTYHMARVVHWIQNRSVAHYPTHITRQLYSAPWAEFSIMHLQILSGGDRFANLTQWVAMVGSVIGTSLIAERLGASPRIQLLSAALTASIPMGILQASSTQNDYVLAFWLVCFVYFGIWLVKNPDFPTALACGGSIGLAILTKGTAYIFAFPFIIWLLIAGIKANRYRWLKYIALAAVLAIGLNAGHYWRNYALWGNPLSTDGDQLTNERVTFPATLSNLSRNLVSNTWTSSGPINLQQFKAVAVIHDVLGIDLNDPGTTFAYDFVPLKLSRDEDYAGNGLHLMLLLVAFATLLVRRNSFARDLQVYGLSIAGGFLLFCMLIKWQPWGTRLQLPFFVLASPLTALALPLMRVRCATAVTAALVVLCSFPWLFRNETRPLLGPGSILTTDRESLYFVKRPEFQSYFTWSADLYSTRQRCKTIGIDSATGNGWEYPLWVMLKTRQGETPRIEHIRINNVTASIPLNNFYPCASFEIH